MPTAWVSVFLVLFFPFWLLSGQFRLKFERVRANPAAVAALAMFVLYALGTLYSPAPAHETFSILGKYHKLLYIPIIASFLDNDAWRRRIGDAFFWGMLLVLVLSYLELVGLYPYQDIGQGYFVFKGRIAHNIFMAFTVYLALERAQRDVSRRWVWTAVAVLAIVNLLVMVNGRTGQVVLPFVLALFAGKHWGWRGMLGTVLVCMLFSAAVVWLGNPADIRMLQIRHEVLAYLINGSEQTSSGQRVEFYQNTLALARMHPWFGWGTGSFLTAYSHYAQLHGFALTQVANPHNEYLLTLQQLGIFGLSMLLIMGWSHWRAVRGLPEVEGDRLRALIVVIGIGALFNSLMMDAGEGKFYCLMAGIYLSGWRAPALQETKREAAS